MKIIKGKFEDLKQEEDLCVAIGMFDGVHRGHKAIIKEAVKISKKKNMKSAVFTFNIHPRTLIENVVTPPIITTNECKAKIIENLGVDYLFFVEFDEELRDVKDIDFLRNLIEIFNVKALVCGYNYNFGKDGSGDIELLNEYKDILNYELKVVDRVSFNSRKISSSIIRNKILSGNIKEANYLLGHNLSYSGEVIRGKNLANTIGFPTANVYVEPNMCFKNGVYVSLTYIGNEFYQSITNIGYTPTVQNDFKVMETNIFGFYEDIYGKNIRVEFLEFLREETKFSSVEKLKERVFKDICKSKEYFNKNIYNS